MDNEKILEEMNSTVKGIEQAVADNSKEFKTDVEATRQEMESIQKSVKEQGEQLDSLTSAIQQSGKRGEKRELTELEIKYNRAFGQLMAGQTTVEEVRGLTTDYKNAMLEAAEKAGDTKTVDQLKSFASDSIEAGGALVPVQMANRIVELQRDFSDIRSVASVETSDIGGLILPGESDDFGFGWVGERETRSTDDSGKFYDVEIPLNEARARVPVTNKMRLNRAFDMDSWISRKAASRLSRGEGNAFVVGNGHKKPKGFMTYDAGTDAGQVQQVTTAGSNAIIHEDITDLITPLRGEYRKNARILMNRFTEGYVQKLDDGQGNPLFNRGDLSKAIPNALKGYPIMLVDDMAGASESDGTLADNALVMCFGDMAEFYTITDHTTSMIMFIDPYSNANDGLVNFRFHKFVGGGVSNFEAAKILKVTA